MSHIMHEVRGARAESKAAVKHAREAVDGTNLAALNVAKLVKLFDMAGGEEQFINNAKWVEYEVISRSLRHRLWLRVTGISGVVSVVVAGVALYIHIVYGA